MRSKRPPTFMTMAKFLVEDGRCRWAFSGSMLGTQFKGVRSYPVGYVHELRMFPLDFEEFCWATGGERGGLAKRYVTRVSARGPFLITFMTR